jgi:integrator complex subunit 11
VSCLLLCAAACAGAGQDVGKSCVVVRLGGKTFMFDCGMHLGYQDERR